MITEEQIETIKEANPGVELIAASFESIDADIVFKVPSEGEWKRFVIEALDSDAKRLVAIRFLVFGHVVFPDKTEFSDLVARKPGIVTNVYNKIADAVGVTLESTVRKL